MVKSVELHVIGLWLELYDYDPGTATHCLRVASLSVKLGRILGLEEKDLLTLFLGALIHDLGKVKIAVDILRKNGPLNDDEYQLIKRHPEWGKEILDSSGIAFPKGIVDIVLFHHVWWNGKGGYPIGMRGKKIPLIVNIVSVADAVDAMMSRPYSERGELTAVCAELRRMSGKQFCPRVVQVFLNNFGIRLCV